MQIQRLMAGSTLALAVALASAPASAAIIVDTGEGLGSLGPDLNATQGLAARFTVTTTTQLTDLTGFMRANSAPGTFTVAVREDGETPGAVLFSDTATADVSDGFYGLHGASWLVGPGSYWLAFQVRPGDTLDGNMPNEAPSPQATEAYYWEITWAGGSAAGWEQYNHLGLGVRISGDAVAAVPEPASWALMLTGFLGAGAALRRDRRRQPALAV